MDDNHWDDFYREDGRIWSGAPNGTLVDEVADLTPGRALDIGCGEGDDARWLAARGWTVVAVDISGVAIGRAVGLGSMDQITWLQSDVAADGPPDGAFDLVSMQYTTISKDAGEDALRHILDATAVGGSLLMVGHEISADDHHRHHRHDNDDTETPRWRGIDPHTLYQPAEVADLLGDGWTVTSLHTRPRPHAPTGGGGAHHVNDTVLRAVRTA